MLQAMLNLRRNLHLQWERLLLVMHLCLLGVASLYCTVSLL